MEPEHQTEHQTEQTNLCYVHLPTTRAGMAVEIDIPPQEAAALLERLAAFSVSAHDAAYNSHTVIGLRAPLLDSVSDSVLDSVSTPKSKSITIPAFTALENQGMRMPSTQRGLWVWIRAAEAGIVFQAMDALLQALAIDRDSAGSEMTVTSLFTYRENRDLTGYVDGTENPDGEEADDAVWIKETGGTYVLTQRFVHAHRKFRQLPQNERNDVIGRDAESDDELADAPESAHVKRTAQESYDPAAFMLRRSMPWGDVMRHGLYFVAFINDVDKTNRMLRRMMGLDADALPDALLRYTTAETGAYYYVPPLRNGCIAFPQ